MPNLVEVNYGQTGESTNTDEMGMREMQARAEKNGSGRLNRHLRIFVAHKMELGFFQGLEEIFLVSLMEGGQIMTVCKERI